MEISRYGPERLFIVVGTCEYFLTRSLQADRLTATLVNRLTAKLMNRLTAKLVDRLTAKLVVVNLAKLHLTKFIPSQYTC